MPQTQPIYLDYNATTPLSAGVIAAMRPFLEEYFGNSSSSHAYGRIAKAALDTARRQVARLIGASPGEIIFTSGGTEANNLAILGVARAYRSKGQHMITSAVEHPAVTEVCAYLSSRGFRITTLPVDSYGRVAPQELSDALTPETILVSIMHANNEVGTIQPIRELASLAHRAGALFHTDAAQSAGKIPVNVGDLGIDLLSIAGHKLYAPKGVGALYIRAGVRLEKITFGTGQEKGLRPGTENMLEIVGLGAAAEEAQQTLNVRKQHLATMRDRLHFGLEVALPPGVLRLNGHSDERLPNTLNLSFHNIEANTLLDSISGFIAASAGAACHAGHIEVSGVLRAMNVPMAWAKGALRFSVGTMTSSEEIDRAVEVITQAFRLVNSKDD
ncbi:MAG: cysteine desulfurase [Chloroflexi bacterium]|nr:cysteine desulfurase [Chloroflexota bacterium]